MSTIPLLIYASLLAPVRELRAGLAERLAQVGLRLRRELHLLEPRGGHGERRRFPRRLRSRLRRVGECGLRGRL